MKNGKYILTTGVFALVSGIALSGLLPMQRAKAEESKENVLIVYAINKNGITKLNPVMNEETKVESGGGEGEETTVLPPSTSEVIIKQGNGTVVVWSETPIDDLDQFKNDYLAMGGRDPSIKDDDKFVPISGYGTFDMNATLSNPWKTYTFGVNPDTGDKYFTATGDAYSHINIQHGTPTPTLPGNTPTPTLPGQTPTPTLPGNTPTPTDPGTTPTPYTTSYPKTGYNDKNMTLKQRWEVTYGNMTKEEKESIIASIVTIGVGALTATGCVIVNKVKTKRRRHY